MLKRIFLISTISLFFIILLFVFLHWRTNVISGLIEDIINNNLSDVARIEYDTLTGDILQNITITNIKVTLNDGSILISNKLKIRYSLFATASGEYLFDSIVFDSLVVTLPEPEKKTGESDPQKADINSENKIQAANYSSQLKSIINGLPEAELDNFEIRYGKLIMPSQNATVDSIQVKLSAQTNSGLFDLILEELSGKLIQNKFRLNHLQAKISGNSNRIGINQFQIETPYSSIFAKTEITLDDSLWIVLNVDDTHIGLNDLQSFIALPGLDSGIVNLSCDLAGSPNRFSTKLSLVGNVNQYALDLLHLDADYNKGIISLRKGEIVAKQSTINFNGTFSERLNSAQFFFHSFDVGRFIPDTINTSLTGRLSFNFDQVDLKNINGAGELFLTHSRIDSFTFDTLRFSINAVNNNFYIVEPSFLKLGENAKFSVKGNLSNKNNLDLDLYTENHSLRTLSSSLNIDSLGGVFDGNLFVTGNLFDPDLEGFIWMPVLIKNDLKLDTTILQLQLNNILSKRHGGAHFSISRCTYGDFQLSETLLDITFDSNRIQIDTLLFANLQNYVVSSGYFEFRQDTMELALDFFRINYQGYWIENSEQILLTMNSEEFNVEQGQLSGPNDAILEIRGFWDKKSDDFQAGLYLNNINIEPFNQFLKEDIKFSGNVEGNFELINPHKALELEVEMYGKNLTYNDSKFGDIKCEFKFIDNKLYFNEFNLVNGSSKIDINGDLALEFSGKNNKKVNLFQESFADVQVSWDKINLKNYSPLFKTNKSISGEISGLLNVSGTITDPKGQLVLHADDIIYDKFSSDSISLLAHFNKDSIVLDTLVGDLNGTSFEAKGWQLVSLNLSNLDSLMDQRPFELKITSKDDQIEFIGFILDQVERLTGEYEMEMIISGTPKNPTIKQGYLELKDGILELSRVRNPITELQLDAEIKDSILTINSFSGISEKEKDLLETTMGMFTRFFRFFKGSIEPEGVINGSGTINLTDIRNPDIDLQIDMNMLYIDYFIENTVLVISTDDFHIFGKDTINMTGTLTIDEGNYLVDIPTLQKNIYLKETTTKKGRPLAMIFDISLPGNFTIGSSKLDLVNNFQLEIMGNLRAIQEPFVQNTELAGHMEILSGKYGSWGQDFEVKSGTVDFTNPKVINPGINIRAEKQTGQYIFELTVMGNLDKLQYQRNVRDLDGNYLPLTEEEKLTILSIGSTELSNEALLSAGEGVINTSVETMLERGAESATGLDKIEIKSDKGLVDFKSMKLNSGLRDASISIGKYLSSSLYLEYKSKFGGGMIPAPKLSWEPGNQLGLEYRINKNWSIDSFYSQTQLGNNQIQISLSWKTTF